MDYYMELPAWKKEYIDRALKIISLKYPWIEDGFMAMYKEETDKEAFVDRIMYSYPDKASLRWCSIDPFLYWGWVKDTGDVVVPFETDNILLGEL